MALHWIWPESWESIKGPIIESIQTSFRSSMSESKSDAVRGEVVIEDLYFGSKPPEIHFNKIRELSLSHACIELFVRYKGDAFLKLSGLEINLDSCVKDTPFFCPFGMRLCDFDIECIVKINYDCTKRNRLPGTDIQKKEIVWAPNADDALLHDATQLTSIAPTHVTQNMHLVGADKGIRISRKSALQSTITCVHSPGSTCSPFSERYIYDMCLGTGHISRSNRPDVSTSNEYLPAQTVYQYIFRCMQKGGYFKRGEIVNSCIRKNRKPFSNLSTPQIQRIPKPQTAMQSFSKCIGKITEYIDPQEENFSPENINESKTESTSNEGFRKIMRKNSTLGYSIMKKLHLHAHSIENEILPSNQKENTAADGPSVTRISIQFDRNPLRNFAVQSNFSSVDGADEKVEATLRNMLDPALESIRKDGFTVIL